MEQSDVDRTAYHARRDPMLLAWREVVFARRRMLHAIKWESRPDPSDVRRAEMAEAVALSLGDPRTTAAEEWRDLALSEGWKLRVRLWLRPDLRSA